MKPVTYTIWTANTEENKENKEEERKDDFDEIRLKIQELWAKREQEHKKELKQKKENDKIKQIQIKKTQNKIQKKLAERQKIYEKEQKESSEKKQDEIDEKLLKITPYLENDQQRQFRNLWKKQQEKYKKEKQEKEQQQNKPIKPKYNANQHLFFKIEQYEKEIGIGDIKWDINEKKYDNYEQLSPRQQKLADQQFIVVRKIEKLFLEINNGANTKYP